MKNITFLLFLSIFFVSCINKKDINPQCLKKPDGGMCRAYFVKYYFDKNKSSCQDFVWGGCAGSVPFENKDECIKTCED